MDISFDIKKDSRGKIIIRQDGEYSQHAHIKTIKGCMILLRLIKNNRLPKSQYLQESCKRLLTNDEFKMLKQDKQCYININKGVKKR